MNDGGLGFFAFVGLAIVAMLSLVAVAVVRAHSDRKKRREEKLERFH